MRTSRHYTDEEAEWIRRNYKRLDWYQMQNQFKERFGYHRCGMAIRRKGYNMGLRKMDEGINSSWSNRNRIRRKELARCGGLINYFLNGNV